MRRDEIVLPSDHFSDRRAHHRWHRHHPAFAIRDAGRPFCAASLEWTAVSATRVSFPAAVLAVLAEALRVEPVSRRSSGVTSQDIEVGGVSLPEGCVPHTVYQSAKVATGGVTSSGRVRYQLSEPKRPRIHPISRGAHRCLGEALALANSGSLARSLDRSEIPQLRLPAPEYRIGSVREAARVNAMRVSWQVW